MMRAVYAALCAVIIGLVIGGSVQALSGVAAVLGDAMTIRNGG